jgi:NADH:ubiquinone oxidoreductase subunit 6 (subunit J)
MLVPVSASVIVSIIRGAQLIPVVVIALMGIAVAFCLFATIASGVTSSHRWTFFRQREPVRFWIGVVILALWYILMCISGWAVPTSPP